MEGTIDVSRIVKDREYFAWKDDKIAFLEKEVAINGVFNY